MQLWVVFHQAIKCANKLYYFIVWIIWTFSTMFFLDIFDYWI
jgi:hypothetical protein